MTPVAHSVPVSVIIPTKNEEELLPGALASVAPADEVVVVDSASTDATGEVAARAGARVVQFHYDGTGPKKKTWAVQSLDLRNEWILILDADERITPELWDDIAAAIERGDHDGYCLDREFVFLGRSLRCFRPNWNLRLFRRGRGQVEDLGLGNLPGTGDNEIHEHVQIAGTPGYLGHHLLHLDDRGITDWLARHNRYATWEAYLYARFLAEPIGGDWIGQLRDPFRRKRFLRRVWVRVPGRPLIRFVTWYVGRRGFLDGYQGFVYCVLMAYYELTITLKLRELRTHGAVRGVA